MGIGILTGVGFAAVAIGLAQSLGRLRGSALLALLLVAAAAVYVGATLGDHQGSAAITTAALVLFGALALWGVENPWPLAVGWLAHAGWDLLHVLGLMDSRAPHWYELACLVADPLIAAYLFILATGQRQRAEGR